MMKFENKSFPKNVTYEKIYKTALEIFDGNKDKLNSWWMGKSDLFDGKAPYELVKEGKGYQLMKIINRCLV